LSRFFKKCWIKRNNISSVWRTFEISISFIKLVFFNFFYLLERVFLCVLSQHFYCKLFKKNDCEFTIHKSNFQISSFYKKKSCVFCFHQPLILILRTFEYSGIKYAFQWSQNRTRRDVLNRKRVERRQGQVCSNPCYLDIFRVCFRRRRIRTWPVCRRLAIRTARTSRPAR